MKKQSIKRILIGMVLLAGMGLAQGVENFDRALDNWMEWRGTLVYAEVSVGQSPEQYRQMAQELAGIAQAAYPTAFYDLSLWRTAVHHAEMAYRQEPQNPDNMRLLAQLYTTTQFWYPAYLLWASLDQQSVLVPEDRSLAALSAAKMGLYRHQMGMQLQAMAYLEISLRFQYDAHVDEFRKAVQSQKSVSSF